MSPFLFRVPSTLYTFLAFSRRLVGSRRCVAYWWLMKFSVAPESRSAGVLALLLMVWIKTRIDIDCRFDRNTRSELSPLIKAELIRRRENPASPLSLYSPQWYLFRWLITRRKPAWLH